jgi:hypothetical protein
LTSEDHKNHKNREDHNAREYRRGQGRSKSRGPGGRETTLPRVLKILLGTAMAAAFFAAALLTSTELVAYGIPEYFPHEFRKYDVYNDLPMKEADVDRVIKETMEYLRGDRESLVDVTAQIDGTDGVRFYDDSEVSHMADVRALFVGGLKLRNALAAFLAVCVCLLAAVARSSGKGQNQKRAPGTGEEENGRSLSGRLGFGSLWCAGVLRTFADVQLFMIAACAVTALYASTDFTRFFTMFHKVFFPQGNWEFDPAKSLMINMLPEGLFSDTAMYIVLIFAVAEIAAVVLARQLAHRLERGVDAEGAPENRENGMRKNTKLRDSN